MNEQLFFSLLLGVNLGLTACSSSYNQKEDGVLRDISQQQVVQAITGAASTGNAIGDRSPCMRDRSRTIVCNYELLSNEKIMIPGGMRQLVSGGQAEDEYSITFHDDIVAGFYVKMLITCRGWARIHYDTATRTVLCKQPSVLSDTPTP